MESFKRIDYDVVDGRAEIFFDRPDVMNAFDKKIVDELNIALKRAMSDRSVYVIIISGRGRGFSAGVDLNSDVVEKDVDKQQKVETWDWVSGLLEYWKTLLTGPTPSIAAINGPAIGGGMELALCCDLRIMSEDAFMNDRHSDLGAVPGLGTGWRFPQLVGHSKAMEYVLLGKDIDAETALDLGLIVDAVEDDELIPRARELGDEIVNKPVRGVQAAKRMVGSNMSMEDHAQAFFETRWQNLTHPEHKEAARAFHESGEVGFQRDL